MTDNLAVTGVRCILQPGRIRKVWLHPRTGFWPDTGDEHRCPNARKQTSYVRVIIFGQCVQTDDDWREFELDMDPDWRFNWVGQEITVWQQNKIMKMKWRNDKISKTRRDIKRALVDLIIHKPKILISKLLPNTSWYLSKPKSWKLVTALMIWNRVRGFCLELTCFSAANMPHMSCHM